MSLIAEIAAPSAADRPGSTEPAPRADPDDLALLRAHLAGDRTAFGELVRRYRRPVLRLALRYAKDADEADELAQRTFLRALDHAADLAGGGSFKAFLFRIAANLCKNHLRDRARLVFGVPFTVAAEEGEPLERREQRARVRAALAHLPLRQRQVVSLRIDADLPFAEIAQSLGTTENSAKVSFHHAVKKLKALLAEEEEP